MSSIVVVRGAGDRTGPPIVEPLLTSVEAKRERGRVALDTYATAKQPVRLTVVYRTGLRLGQLVEVHDSVQGKSWRGKLVGIEIDFTGAETLASLSILRPVEGGF